MKKKKIKLGARHLLARGNRSGTKKTSERSLRKKSIDLETVVVVISESGNGNAFPFPLIESLSVVNSGQ